MLEERHLTIDLICLWCFDFFFFLKSDTRIPRYLKFPFTEELMSNTLILLGLLLNENLLGCIYMNWITFEKESSAFVFCVYKN